MGKPLRDVAGPGMRILFCGINPSLASAARGHHYAGPGNRFWAALHGAGLTPRLLTPEEDGELTRHGLGLTNLVDRPTRAASELRPEELRAGRAALERLVRRWRPGTVAVVGAGAYRTAFERPRAPIGPQEELFAGARLWVLPNPSGLNATHQLPDLVRLFGELRRADPPPAALSTPADPPATLSTRADPPPATLSTGAARSAAGVDRVGGGGDGRDI